MLTFQAFFVRIVGTRSAVSAEEPLRNSTLPSEQDTPSVFLLKQKSSSLREGAEEPLRHGFAMPPLLSGEAKKSPLKGEL